MQKHGNALSSGQLRQMLSILASQFPLDMDADVADGWIKNPTAVGKVLRDGLRVPEVLTESANLFPLLVDYTHSLAQMIASGNFNWANPGITEKNFPVAKVPSGLPTKAEINLELLHSNRYISSNDVLKEMDRQGYRPATIQELLSFGVKYPEEQRKYPIVALGSVWQHVVGDRRVPCLACGAGGRDLELYSLEDGCLLVYRFAAVRK